MFSIKEIFSSVETLGIFGVVMFLTTIILGYTLEKIFKWMDK